MVHARAVLNHAGEMGDFGQRFWAYGVALVTYLNNIAASNKSSPFEKLFKVNVKMKTELRVFGKLGYV